MVKKIFIKLTFIILIFFNTNTLFANNTKVTLQLSWFNQFQFAGYYIAKEKGFYDEVGLDVEIRPFRFGLNLPSLVNQEKVDFAIGRETLILEKSKNKDLVALLALFQTTPLVLISKVGSGINSIEDFKNKRIMTTIDDASEISLKAMISSHKIKLSDINFIKHSHDINDLINDKTDLVSGYVSKALYHLEKKGIKYNIFDPKDYGFDTYSDFLFTSKKFLKTNPKISESFKNASLKGWEYAYSNIEETVDLILEKYNTQNLTRDELLFEAKELRKLSYFDTTKLGEIKKEKIIRIHDLYNILGLLDNPIKKDDSIFNDNENNTKIDLDEEDEKYVLENKIVNMCIIPDIKPYSFIENGKLEGFAKDYFNLIEEKTKLSFRLVETSSLRESLEFLIKKKCDILASAEKTEDRKGFALFTEPFLNVPFVLTTKVNKTFIEDLTVIKDKKIGLVESYSVNKKIKKLYPNIEFVDVKDLNDGINRVLSGELYGHIDLLYTSWYKIYSNDLTKLRISSQLNITVPISIAIRKDLSTLHKILNKAVKNITNKDRDEILKKWIAIDYKKETDYALLWWFLVLVGFILLAILYRQKILKDLNKKLEIKVDEKNKELLKINSELEQKVKEEVEENLKKDRLLSQQSKMIAMGQMIENIAHQWRQPLSTITTAASGIKLKHEVNDLQENFLKSSIDSILNTSNYLSDTIDDFRFFFELQKEKNTFILENCCKRTVDLVLPTFKIKNISIKINCGEEIKVNSYERELIQVLINILNNSKDALEKFDKNKLIFIDIFKIKDKGIIEIKDNAGGIKEEILDKIYEPYFTTKHSSQGTGIGLYMCREIVIKHMHGKIQTKNVSFMYKDEKQTGALTTIILDTI